MGIIRLCPWGHCGRERKEAGEGRGRNAAGGRPNPTGPLDLRWPSEAVQVIRDSQALVSHLSGDTSCPRCRYGLK